MLALLMIAGVVAACQIGVALHIPISAHKPYAQRSPPSYKVIDVLTQHQPRRPASVFAASAANGIARTVNGRFIYRQMTRCCMENTSRARMEVKGAGSATSNLSAAWSHDSQFFAYSPI